MSREIKFRVWSEEDREYRTDCNLTGLFNSVTGTPATIYSDEGDRFDIEQYTGLKDKNGKEIYEGDIVELDWYIYGDKPAYRVKSKVIFDEEGARVCNGKHSDLLKYCTGIEVIGNIHKNPELLGGKK